MSAGFLFMAINRMRGRRWLVLRSQVLSAEPRCLSCLQHGRLSAANEVDHIVPLQHGGTDDVGNLQPLCHDCHANKSVAERGAQRKPTIGVDGWPVNRTG